MLSHPYFLNVLMILVKYYKGINLFIEDQFIISFTPDQATV